MVTLSIQVNAIWGGTIREAIENACRISKQIGIGVEFEFNNVKMSVWPENTVSERLSYYHSEFKRIHGSDDSRKTKLIPES